jgi:beta-lactamase regulating signal transducer with metallopeptidase domain
MIGWTEIDWTSLDRAALEYAINSLWQLPLLGGAAWLAIRLLSPAPRIQHRLWIAVLVLAVALPAHGVHWTSPVRPTQPEQLEAPSAVLSAERAARVESESDTRTDTPTTSQVPSTLSAHTPALHLPMVRLPMSVRALEWFARLYSAVVLLGALRIVRAAWSARSLVGRSRTIALPEPLATHWLKHGQQASVRLPQLRESDEVAGPAIVGMRAPVLLVPSGFLRHTEAQVKAALCHELAHVVRQDYAANLLCQVLALPVVWHPVTHAVQRRIGRTREMLCDAMAASRMESNVVYARALLALAQEILARRDASRVHGLGLLGNNTLEERVERLMAVTETNMETMSVRAKLARLTAAAGTMAASMLVAATFHVAPLLAQSTDAPKPDRSVAQLVAPPGGRTSAVQAAPSPSSAVAPAKPQLPAATAPPVPEMPGTANPPAEPELPAQMDVPVIPAAPNLDRQPSPPANVSIGTGSVVLQDSTGPTTHIHRWISADGHHYVVLNDQATELTDADKQRIELETVDAHRLAAAAAVKIDKDFRLRVEKQVKDATAYLTSREFKQQMAGASRNESVALAKLSPQMKEQLAHLNSPGFRKQIAEAGESRAKALAQLNASQAETERRMEDATRRMDEATKRLEAATRALEQAQAQMNAQKPK